MIALQDSRGDGELASEMRSGQPKLCRQTKPLSSLPSKPFTYEDRSVITQKLLFA